MQTEMRACPRGAGGKVGLLRNADGWWQGWCECGWQGPLHERKAEAIAAWNTRIADEDAVEAVRSNLIEMRSATKLAMQTLSAIGDTEDGVSCAYTTLALALEQTKDAAIAQIREREERK